VPLKNILKSLCPPVSLLSIFCKGFFECQEDQWANPLQKVGEDSFERVSRIPFDEYQKRLKSEIADVKSWDGCSPSSSVYEGIFYH